MKFRVNILLKCVILATIVILPEGPEACQEQMSMNETLTDETSTNETSSEGLVLEVIPYSILYVPDKDVAPCADGQKKDSHGNCRKILTR